MGFIVRRAGAFSLLVDAGRPGLRHLGVPFGGPADRAAWILGNCLARNSSCHLPLSGGDGDRSHALNVDCTALEIAWQGPLLEATTDHVLVVWGAAFSVVHRTDSTAHHIPTGRLFRVEAGDWVDIQTIAGESGLRAYLCVSGGFDPEPILGSQSAFGPVSVGNVISCRAGQIGPLRFVQIPAWQEEPVPGIVRIVPGSHITSELSRTLALASFRVRPESSRMGLRLESAQSWQGVPDELVSAPVTPGTIQLPPGGQPIILGVDAQTIGGYPRLGHVISADLDRLSQLRPGDSLRLKTVTLVEAEALHKSRSVWLRSWAERLLHAI